MYITLHSISILKTQKKLLDGLKLTHELSGKAYKALGIYLVVFVKHGSVCQILIFSLAVADCSLPEMSKAERLLSYSLLSLITSKPLASAPTTGTVEEDNHYNAKDAGLMNEDGAWCWREGCSSKSSYCVTTTILITAYRLP